LDEGNLGSIPGGSTKHSVDFLYPMWDNTPINKQTFRVKNMKSVKSIFQSLRMKEVNANKAKLTPNARAIYLAGIAGLGKCEEVAKTFSIRSVAKPAIEV